MEFSSKKVFIILLILASLFLLYFSFTFINKNQYLINKVSSKDFIYGTNSITTAVDSLNLADLPKKLENPPVVLKAIYITGWSAGSKKYLNYLNELFKTTQINSVVIDIKENFGSVSYKTGAKKAKEYKAYYPEISDINALVKELHSQGIYVIGRMVIFEDSILAKNRPDLAVYDKSKTQDLSKLILWQDNHSLSWVDPASQEVWDYNIEIARDAVSHGFDEINFDYVRFPTDGKLDNIGFPVWDQKIPRHLIINNFFKKLRESLPDTKISIDLFGQTTTNTDDMGIGQTFEDSLNYFDYVCPMVYPSHYINGFLGFKNPADHPYQIIKYATDSAIARQKVYAKINNKLAENPHDQKIGVGASKLAKIRPWLQDFNLGAIYNTDMVLQEIKAVSDSTGADFNGYLLWNPSNIYTKGAIIKEDIMPK